VGSGKGVRAATLPLRSRGRAGLTDAVNGANGRKTTEGHSWVSDTVLDRSARGPRTARRSDKAAVALASGSAPLTATLTATRPSDERFVADRCHRF